MFDVPESNTTDTLPVIPHPVQAVVMWIGVLSVVVLNIIVFVVTPRMKNVKQATVSGILSLAVTDFLHGIIATMNMTYQTYTGYNQKTGQPLCITTGIAISLTALVSGWTLTLMNVDRLLLFALPLHYRPSKRQAISAFVGIWVCVIAVLLPGASGALEPTIRYYKYAFMCKPDNAVNVPYKIVMVVLFFIIPTVINIICFSGYFYYAHKSHRFTQSLQVPQQTVDQRKHQAQWKHNVKLLKTLIFMSAGEFIIYIDSIFMQYGSAIDLTKERCISSPAGCFISINPTSFERHNPAVFLQCYNVDTPKFSH